MFWARMKHIGVISSVPGYPKFVLNKSLLLQHSSGHGVLVGPPDDEGDLRLEVGHHPGLPRHHRKVARALVVQTEVLGEALGAEHLETLGMDRYNQV